MYPSLEEAFYDVLQYWLNSSKLQHLVKLQSNFLCSLKPLARWLLDDLDLNSATEIWPLADPACQCHCKIQNMFCLRRECCRYDLFRCFNFQGIDAGDVSFQAATDLPPHPLPYFTAFQELPRSSLLMSETASPEASYSKLHHLAPVKIFWDYFHTLPITFCWYHVASFLLLLGKTSISSQPLCTWVFFTVYKGNGT